MSSLLTSTAALSWASSRALAETTPRRLDFAARLTIHSSDDDSDGGSTLPDDTGSEGRC